MAIQKIFKATLPSFKFYFKNGVAANFLNGRFTTDNKALEDELMEEVGEVGRTKSRNTFIFVDENEPELDTEALSPIELIKLQAKEEARAELLAEFAAQQARAMNAEANVSSTSSNHAASVNTTAKMAAALNGEAAPAPVMEAATPSGLGARLAGLNIKKS